MATAMNNHEDNNFDDLVTCGVCLCQFNEDNRKPKFLPCSHSVCITCVREILDDAYTIVCPFCRKISQLQSVDVQSLPNNTYALHMLKFLEKKNKSWCFTCGSLAKTSCCSLFGHCLFDMSAHTLNNIESFIGLQEAFKKMNNEGTNKLALALGKRKEIQKHLDLLVSSVHVALDEILRLQDENNLEMAELASVIERETSSTSEAKEGLRNDSKESFLYGLKSLAENFSPDDTAESFEEKCKKFFALGEEKLKAATIEASKYEEHKQLRLAVNLLDENCHSVPTCAWLQDGFRLLTASGGDGLSDLGSDEIRKKLSLLSHLVFSLLSQKQERGSSSSHTTSSRPSIVNHSPANVGSLSTLSSSRAQPIPKLYVLNASSFLLGQSIFILRIFQNKALISKVHIHPTFTSPTGPHFLPFVMELGNFCFKSPKIFSRDISKAVGKVFVSIHMANSSFNPISSTLLETDKVKSASSLNEVGLTTIKHHSQKGFGWSFIFPLENYTIPKYSMHVRDSANNMLFGNVIQSNMLDPIIKLSSSSVSERVGYSMTLESR